MDDRLCFDSHTLLCPTWTHLTFTLFSVQTAADELDLSKPPPEDDSKCNDDDDCLTGKSDVEEQLIEQLFAYTPVGLRKSMHQLLRNCGIRRGKMLGDTLPALSHPKQFNNSLSPAEQLAALQAQLLSLAPRKASPSLPPVASSQPSPPTSSVHISSFSPPLASPISSLVTTSATSTAPTPTRPLMIDNHTNTLNSGTFIHKIAFSFFARQPLKRGLQTFGQLFSKLINATLPNHFFFFL